MASVIEGWWLRPAKPENISVGRHQVADRLRDRGIDVEVKPATRTTAARLRREDVDVVIGTTRAGALIGGACKLLRGTPLVVDHIDPIRQFYDTAPSWLARPVHAGESAAFALADHVCYVTSEDGPRVERWARSSSKTTLGVDFGRFADPSEQSVARATAALSDHRLDEHVAIYVGGLETTYNISSLLDALELADGWTLLVLGDGSLSELVRQSEHAIHLGTVPYRDVPGYLRLADVGVNLADERTLKVLEYAAARLPIVHAAGRVADRFGDLVVPTASDPHAIAKALDEAVGMRAEALDKMQRHARERDWEVVADVYEAAIKGVLDGHEG